MLSSCMSNVILRKHVKKTWRIVWHLLYLSPLAKNKNSIMSEGNIIVHVKDNESVERALKRFKKRFEKVCVLKQLRKRTFYKKPSMQRREERLKAIYKQKMQAHINV